jgi:hypothetical protein
VPKANVHFSHTGCCYENEIYGLLTSGCLVATIGETEAHLCSGEVTKSLCCCPAVAFQVELVVCVCGRGPLAVSIYICVWWLCSLCAAPVQSRSLLTATSGISWSRSVVTITHRPSFFCWAVQLKDKSIGFVIFYLLQIRFRLCRGVCRVRMGYYGFGLGTPAF